MIILYIILGLAIGFIAAFMLGGFAMDHTRSVFGEKMAAVVALIIGVIVAGLCIAGFCDIDTNEEQEFIANFEAQKVLIEESIQNEALTGYERVQLVNNAAELNSELAERKVKISHWYNFHIDDDLYNDVTPISLGTKEEK